MWHLHLKSCFLIWSQITLIMHHIMVHLLLLGINESEHKNNNWGRRLERASGTIEILVFEVQLQLFNFYTNFNFFSLIYHSKIFREICLVLTKQIGIQFCSFSILYPDLTKQHTSVVIIFWFYNKLWCIWNLINFCIRINYILICLLKLTTVTESLFFLLPLQLTNLQIKNLRITI